MHWSRKLGGPYRSCKLSTGQVLTHGFSNCDQAFGRCKLEDWITIEGTRKRHSLQSYGEDYGLGDQVVPRELMERGSSDERNHSQDRAHEACKCKAGSGAPMDGSEHQCAGPHGNLRLGCYPSSKGLPQSGGVTESAESCIREGIRRTWATSWGSQWWFT